MRILKIINVLKKDTSIFFCKFLFHKLVFRKIDISKVVLNKKISGKIGYDND